MLRASSIYGALMLSEKRKAPHTVRDICVQTALLLANSYRSPGRQEWHCRSSALVRVPSMYG